MAGRLAVVVAGDDDRLHMISEVPESPSWSGWVPLGGPPGERLVVPTLTSTLDDRLELFAFSTTHPGMWRRREVTPRGKWDDWVREPDPPAVMWDEGNIAVRHAHDGGLHMFCVNASDRRRPLAHPRNRVWHREQACADGDWSKWRQHGQPPEAEQMSLFMEGNSDGRLELLAGVHTTGARERFEMWRSREEKPNGRWSGWERATDPTEPGHGYLPRAVVRGAGGRLIAFGTRFGMGHIGQTNQKVPGGDWQQWLSLGTPGGDTVVSLAASLDVHGGVHLLALTGDLLGGPSQVWHLQQAGPNGAWSPWSPLGAPTAGISNAGDELAVASSPSGLIHVFATATDGALWSRRLPANDSKWSPWETMGHPATTTRLFMPAARATG